MKLVDIVRGHLAEIERTDNEREEDDSELVAALKDLRGEAHASSGPSTVSQPGLRCGNT
jgi:hypothetical protein